MTDPRGAQQVLRTLLGPDRPEVSCEVCFEKLDRYVEVESTGRNAGKVFPGLLAHFEGCAACREEHQSLRLLLGGPPTALNAG